MSQTKSWQLSFSVEASYEPNPCNLHSQHRYLPLNLLRAEQAMIIAPKLPRLMLRHIQRMRMKDILIRPTRTQVIHIIPPTAIHTVMGILIGPIIRTLAFTHSIVVFMGTVIIPTVIQDITTITTIMVTVAIPAIPEAYTLMAKAINSLRIVINSDEH